MKALLDTNVCIYLIRRKPIQVLECFERYAAGEIGLSSVTLAELQYGAATSQFPERNRQALEVFTLPLEIAPFDAEAAVIYGEVWFALERQGRTIGSMDLMIAAHALSLGVTLITHNTREFERVAGLQVEDWV